MGLRSFCDHIGTDPAAKNQTSPATGWAPVKGVNFTIARMATWPGLVAQTNEYLFTHCEGSVQNSTKVPECSLDNPFEDPAMISWTWQYCTQWGYFQSANLGPKQIVSKFNSLEHQKDICHRQFPETGVDGLPDWPYTNKTNEILGGWKIRPSNVYWSGGEYDPWRTLSPLSQRAEAPKITTIQSAPQCSTSTGQDKLFGYTLKNAQHCYDFRTTGAEAAVLAEGVQSRKYFTSALRDWLKCWKPKNGKRATSFPGSSSQKGAANPPWPHQPPQPNQGKHQGYGTWGGRN